MSFFLGGMRFREQVGVYLARCVGYLADKKQIYNSTVTQMSACLLSLSVISLVLPVCPRVPWPELTALLTRFQTAFHASFSDVKLADAQSLKISRGTSVVSAAMRLPSCPSVADSKQILLLVYIIYLLFQLLSHSYMYESTPQHIIDEEATPGPAANWLDTSSSDDSSSSGSDSTDSEYSRGTISRRMKQVMRRRRKSSVVSEVGEGSRTPSFGASDANTVPDETPLDELSPRPRIAGTKPGNGTLDGNDEAIQDEKPRRHAKRQHRRFHKKHRKQKHKARRAGSQEAMGEQPIDEDTVADDNAVSATPSFGEPRRVDFANQTMEPREQNAAEDVAARNRFLALRAMSLRPVAKSLAPKVFTQPPDAGMPSVPAGPVPRVRYGIRRTNSLPDRLSQYKRPPGAMMPSQIPLAALSNGSTAAKTDEHAEELSRTAAVLLLLISTGLVAVCAEFMVDSINGLVKTSKVGEVFIGLIILPIVGNAAEHVTAITVAMKNKMDLAIGVAVGSSIQIALFITPLVVIIGWVMNREMTLYFTLFETVCLFVSAFITNFLVLDGRSNYLEGALLLATYVIISVVAFFYPDKADASSWGA